MNGKQQARYGILRTWTDILRRYCECPYCHYRASASRRGPGSSNALATAARLKGRIMAHMRASHPNEIGVR